MFSNRTVSAFIERNGTKYINEPHVGGGNPVLAIGGDSSEAIFTDMLGTSLGTTNNETYTAITKTSFGANSSAQTVPTTHRSLQANLTLKIWATRFSSEITAQTWANGSPKTSSATPTAGIVLLIARITQYLMLICLVH